MPYASKIFQRQVKAKLEEKFLGVLNKALPKNVLKRYYNNPLIKDERQMKMTHIYSPTCDVAIGPFSFEEGSLNALYRHITSLGEEGGIGGISYRRRNTSL